MSLKNKVKSKVTNKVKKVLFKIIKPFLPFILIFLGLLFALCTVIDAVFIEETKYEENDIDIDSKLEIAIEKAEDFYNRNTVIVDGSGLVPTGMFIWPTPGYTTITSHFGMRIHPISGKYKMHTRY